MTYQSKDKIIVPDSVLVRELGGESVLLDIASESYFGLDETGTRMWGALTTSPSIGEAFDTLLAEYEVEPDRLRADLDAFMQKLAVAGLLHVQTG